jgi:hypothetical protein
VRWYPDGGEECTITPVIGLRPKRKLLPPDKQDPQSRPLEVDKETGEVRLKEPKARDVNKESAERAKRKVRRIARNAGLKNMCTLTFPGDGIHDYEKAQKAVSCFIRDRSPFLRSRGYLAVPELHPGGHGWHWHILFAGPRCPRSELYEMRQQWTDYLREHVGIPGWDGEGFARTHLKRFGSARRAASYAGKYVSKSIEEGAVPARRHRYLRAAGLGEPVPAVTYHDSWLSAIEDYRHPMWWSAFFDGREIDRPFLYISFDPPEP